MVRELGLKRRETVWSLSAVGVGSLKGAVPSTRGPEWTDLSVGMNNVFMHEAVGMNELLQYTSSADFGAYSVINTNPSHDYSLGNKVFEYLMAGLPVISTNLKGVRAFLKEDFTVFIDDISTDSLNNAIQHFDSLDQVTLQKDIKDFTDYANWDKEQQKLLNIYENA